MNKEQKKEVKDMEWGTPDAEDAEFYYKFESDGFWIGTTHRRTKYPYYAIPFLFTFRVFPLFVYFFTAVFVFVSSILGISYLLWKCVEFLV